MSTNQYIIYKLLNATTFQATSGSCWGNNYTYEFIIDINGNVFVKEGICNYNETRNPNPTKEYFSIIDNIKIPDYIIDLFNHLLEKNSLGIGVGSGNGACNLDKVVMFFELVKELKKSIKIMTNNPQNEKYVKNQLEFTRRKNELIESQLLEMEQKIKNIQNAYFDTIKDNEKIISENIFLKKQIQELENKIIIKNTDSTKYNHTPYDYFSNNSSFLYCYGTPSNAQNRMVYNENTAIYEL